MNCVVCVGDVRFYDRVMDVDFLFKTSWRGG